VAGMLLTTESALAELPEDKSSVPPMPPMGGGGGMGMGM